MTRQGKTPRNSPLHGIPAAVRPAFARLDTILAKNTLSDAEKIDRARRALFGSLPEDAPGRENPRQTGAASPANSNQVRPLKS